MASWRAIAVEEQKRRATRFIEALDDATIAGIADGKIDMAALCQDVLDEMRVMPKPRPNLQGESGIHLNL